MLAGRNGDIVGELYFKLSANASAIFLPRLTVPLTDGIDIPSLCAGEDIGTPRSRTA
jgi:hypothetical protein